jgi:hypothetical protein
MYVLCVYCLYLVPTSNSSFYEKRNFINFGTTLSPPVDSGKDESGGSPHFIYCCAWRIPTLHLLLCMDDPHTSPTVVHGDPHSSPTVVHGGSPHFTYCCTWRIPTLHLLLYMEDPHTSSTVVHGGSPHFTYCCTWRIPTLHLLLYSTWRIPTLHPLLYTKRAPSGLSATPKPLPITKVIISNIRVMIVA